MKHIFAICIFSFYSCVAFTQIKNTERKRLFDYDWRFYLGDTTAAQEKFDDNNWRKLNLPHDWSIEGEVNADHTSKGAGGYFPTGIGWYRKLFYVPAEWKEKRITVYFEGVYMNAEVFINGKSLGVHPYGYSSFTHELSSLLKHGQNNVIAVRVDNSLQLNSRWYSGSGIYRHVWLMVTNPVHIAHWGTAVTSNNVTINQAAVQVKTIVKNQTAVIQKVTVNTILYNNSSVVQGSNKINVQLSAGSEREVVQNIIVNTPALWSVETPALYSAKVTILKAGKSIDESETAFGIRTLKYSVENGFQLNGKTIKLSGGCVHHDNGCLGAAAYDRAEERKVELLKEAGFNAVRTSHNPPSEVFLNVCDRLGLLVMDESFDCWHIGKNKNDYAKYFNEWWKKDLEAMVVRDRNHPSVIMWSTGNEVVERGEQQAVATATMLKTAVKELDTTRPVTSAVVNLNKWENLDSLINVHDIAGYNYHLNTAYADHVRVPSRIIVQTESYPKDAYENWKLVHENSFVIGDFVWTAMDYLGEAGIGRTFYSGETPGENWDNDMFPWHGAYCGDIDLIGNRKPVSHYRSMLYGGKDKLYMAVREPNPQPLKIKETWWSVYPSWESWNWQGFEGKLLEIEVFSKYPKVRLYLNDKLVDEKSTSANEAFKALFSVRYMPGTVKAVGVENEKEVEVKILQTAAAPAKIELTADRNELVANGQDLTFITVGITDANGTPQPNANNRLNFKIEGEGSIAGVANADLKDWDSYLANNRKAWHGKALVVIRSTRKSGEIKITVSSNGLETSVLNLKSVNNAR